MWKYIVLIIDIRVSSMQYCTYIIKMKQTVSAFFFFIVADEKYKKILLKNKPAIRYCNLINYTNIKKKEL